jgi:hypothetical protein
MVIETTALVAALVGLGHICPLYLYTKYSTTTCTVALTDSGG